MKRFLFSGVLVLVALVLLAVAGAGIFISTLDLSTYRSQLSQVAEEALGRPVMIEGEIGHSFMPLGLSLERVIVKDTAEFGSGEFLMVEDVALRVDLQRLATGNISVDEVSVGKAVAHLQVNAAGKKNWEFSRPKGSEEKLTDDTPKTKVSKNKELQLAIRNVSCDATVVTYVDRPGGTDVAVQLEKVALSDLALGIDMPMAVAGVVTDRAAKMTADFSLKSVVRIEESGDVLLRINDFSSKVGKTSSQERLQARIKGEVVYAAKMQSVNLNDISGSFGGVDVKTTLAVILPGGANLAKGRTLDVRGEITLGDINDALLASLAAPFAEGPQAGGAKKTTAKGAGKTMGNKAAGAPDFSALKPLYIDLDVRLNSFSQDALRADNIKLHATLDGGSARIPFSCDFYSGSVSGTLTAALTAKPLNWKIDGKANGIHIGGLMRSLKQKADITGKVGTTFALSGQGIEPQGIKSSLSGTLSCLVQDALVKADFSEEIKRLLQVRDGIPVRKGEGVFAIQRGLVTIQKLDVDSPLATAQGKGQVHLVHETLNIMMDVQPGGIPPSLPLIIDGTFAKPAFNWHASRMLEDTAREIINDPVGSVGRVLDVRDELKAGGKVARENIKDVGKELESVGKGIEGLFKRKK